MTFALLSTLAVLAGIACLAILLWLAQRLRVQHREVEVLSTLFWQAAVEETRARVLVRRFRHWPAWFLLLGIASIMWLLLATPQRISWDAAQHVVLVDGSVESEEIRASDLGLAIDNARRLPDTAREIISVGSQMETLLAAGEPVEQARLRAKAELAIGPRNIGWAVDSLSARANATQPLVIYIVGDASVSQERLAALTDYVSVYRIPREQTIAHVELQTLGIANATSGQWDKIDVQFAFAGTEPISPDRIGVTVDGEPISQSVIPLDGKTFSLNDVDADGGVLTIQADGHDLDSVTLPIREPIRVSLEETVPESLRQMVSVDSACQIVSSNADVRIGTKSDCNFLLATNDQPAFLISADTPNPNAALSELVDELALKQIDATSIAEKSGEIVDVQLESSSSRSIAVWQSLLSDSFDFQESRAFPIFVSRSIRWLANRPPLVPWAHQGERLPVARREFDRVTNEIAVTNDGRKIRAARVPAFLQDLAEIDRPPKPSLLTRLSLPTWLGLLLIGLLVGEWVLFQRGQIP